MYAPTLVTNMLIAGIASGPSVWRLESSANGLEPVGAARAGMKQPRPLALIILWKGSKVRINMMGLDGAPWKNPLSKYNAAVCPNELPMMRNDFEYIRRSKSISLAGKP
jgi:hypothetical protein